MPLNTTEVRSVSIELSSRLAVATDVVTDPLPIAGNGSLNVNVSANVPNGMPLSPKLAVIGVGAEVGVIVGEVVKKMFWLLPSVPVADPETTVPFTTLVPGVTTTAAAFAAAGHSAIADATDIALSNLRITVSLFIIVVNYVLTSSLLHNPTAGRTFPPSRFGTNA
jgi:hypothetical protein